MLAFCTGIMAHHHVMIPGLAFALGVFHDPGWLRAMFEVVGKRENRITRLKLRPL